MSFPTAELSQESALTIVRRLGEHHARAVAEDPVFVAKVCPVAVHEAVLLPPSTAEGVSVETWNGHAQGSNWAVRVTQAQSASQPVRRGFIFRWADAAAAPVFNAPVEETEEAQRWRAVVGDLFDCVSRQASAAYMQTDTLALLRRMLVKTTWPSAEENPDQAAQRASLLERFDRAFNGPRVRGKLRERMEAQRFLVEELQKMYEGTPSIPATLNDIGVGVMTLAASDEGTSRRVDELVLRLVTVGVGMILSEDAPPELDAVRSFLYVVGFHSRELGAALPGIVAQLLEAIISLDDDGHELLLKYVHDVAHELNVTEHVGLVAYESLAKFFTKIMRNPEFREEYLMMGGSGAEQRVLSCAPEFAQLLLHSDSDVWRSVLEFCVSATAAPALFDRVIQDGQLWNPGAALPRARSRLHVHRLGEMLKAIVKLGEKKKNPRLPPAVRCFNKLMAELVRLNAVHLLEIAVLPENPSGPVDSDVLRRFQTDRGMRFPFLASDLIPLRVLFSNALWVVHELIRPILKSDGLIQLPGTPRGFPIASAAGDAFGLAAEPPDDSNGLPLDAIIMTVFRNSIENPILDSSPGRPKLKAALDALVRIINPSPVLATTILGPIGELAPAGYDADGLVPIEAWLIWKVVPALTTIIARVVSLYPRPAGAADSVVLEFVERSVLEDSSVVTAIADFASGHLQFEQPTVNESLGPEVTALVKGVLDSLSAAMRSAAGGTRTARQILVDNLSSISSSSQTMHFFARSKMTKIVGKKVATLYKAVRLMQFVSPTGAAAPQAPTSYWCPADVRKSSGALDAWSDADLLRLSFFKLARSRGEAFIDIDRVSLFGAPGNAVRDHVASAVKVAFPEDRGERLKAVEDAVLAHAHLHNAQALTVHCLREIQEIVTGALSHGAASLAEIALQFQAVAERNLDHLIFPLADFSASFQAHNMAALVALDAPAGVVGEVLSATALQATGADIMLTYAAEFKALSIPISFLNPSQLISLRVATHLVPTDLLMRLGTGQGKSVVLALSAIEALRPPPRQPQPGRVFVITTFDFLARRDHAFGSKLFAHNGLSSCCVTMEPASLAGFEGAKIVYANAVTIDRQLEQLSLKFLSGAALTKDEDAFLRAFFETDRAATYTVLLDEFDLILDDLRVQKPRISKIPNEMLGPDDAERNKIFCPGLAPPLVSWIDVKHDKNVFNIETGAWDKVLFPHMKDSTARWFNLSPSVWRLSEFFERAFRVVGLSGSARSNVSYVLGGRGNRASVPFFELPYSHDPALFDTNIAPVDFTSETTLEGGSVADLKGANGIWCNARHVVASKDVPVAPAKADGDDEEDYEEIARVALLPKASHVDLWCKQVVSDIRSVWNQEGLKRPVLVFAPSEDVLFATGPPPMAGAPPPTKAMTSHLISAVKAAFSADVLNVPPKDRDMTELEIQRIGQAGLITIADLKLGRGVDIRPSPDIPGGLHVLIATEVAQARLLKQMIGRTGRFGREGSYSIITLYRILTPQQGRVAANNQWWMAALHHLSALGLSHLYANRATLAGPPRKMWVQQWLMFLHGCRVRGEKNPTEWCIPDVDFARLQGLAPEGPATKDFYARLAALKAGGIPDLSAD